MSLSEAEVARYARQLILPGMGQGTQELLKTARVHVVGAGEAAGPALVYLALAGVGTVYVDDALDVSPEDAAGWLFGADQAGESRLFAAVAALRDFNAWCRPRAHATGAEPTATLVCTGSPGVAREAAERARVAGLPHVVALVDGDGGEVVSVPPGAPCHACASRPGSGAPARPGTAAAVGALAAAELVLMVTGAQQPPLGRRIALVLGEPRTTATTRVPGCACERGRGA